MAATAMLASRSPPGNESCTQPSLHPIARGLCHLSPLAPYDVVIVGGGPAGLSAALTLGRCRRRVVVVDGGEYRNAAARAVHGLLGHDGVDPDELRRAGRADAARYGVELRHGQVIDAAPVPGGFEASLGGGDRLSSSFLLLATGVRDAWPALPGIEALIGVSVHHCPLCDGWEHRDEPLAALGRGQTGVELALGLTTWSRDVVLFTDGQPLVRPVQAHLARYGVLSRTERVRGLEAHGSRLAAVVLEGGARVERRALFCHLGVEQRSDLARRLGCRFKRGGTVRVGRLGETTVPGVYVAGDAAGDVLLVAVAVAEGAKCGYAINRALREAERP